jgi:hypothetical protein
MTGVEGIEAGDTGVLDSFQQMTGMDWVTLVFVGIAGLAITLPLIKLIDGKSYGVGKKYGR